MLAKISVTFPQSIAFSRAWYVRTRSAAIGATSSPWAEATPAPTG